MKNPDKFFTSSNQETAVNLRSKEWREEQCNLFRTSVEKFLQEVGEKIDDVLTLNVREDYDPDIKNAYFVSGIVRSKNIETREDASGGKSPVKVRSFNIVWSPLKKELTNWMIEIDHSSRHQGIATALTDAAEKIARELGAETLVFDKIIEESMEYWKNRPDVIVEEEHHRATKNLAMEKTEKLSGIII